MGEMAVIGKEGDTKVIWDPKNKDEAEAAKAQFDILREKKFKAFKVDKEGNQTTEIKKFDSKLGKIIMVPALKGG